MRSTLLNNLLLLVILLGCTSLAQAQLTNWQFATTVDVTENRGQADSNYQVPITLNTADLIAQGKLQSNGADLRFAMDCSGLNLMDYYFETPIGLLPTATEAKVWVRFPFLAAGSSNTIYMFSGNPAAAAGSNFSTTFPNSLVITTNTGLTDTLKFDWFQINAGATVDVFDGVPLFITADRIIINGNIDANGAGFIGGTGGFTDGAGPGAGTFSADSSAGAGGGAYGGNGGDGGFDLLDTAGIGGTAYGSASDMMIGFGSGGAGSEDADGGNGGGSIALVGSDITISGNITVNGEDANPLSGVGIPNGAGGGAGGGILVRAENLDVTGTLASNGGNGSEGTGITDNGGGGGSGGRIKIFNYASASLTGVALTTPGVGGKLGTVAFAEDGEDGTIYTEQLVGALQVQTGLLLAKVAPAISGADFDTVCANTQGMYSVAVNGANGYVWSATGGTVSAGQNTSSITVDWTTAGSQEVQVIVTSAFTGCSDTATFDVLVSGVAPTTAFTNDMACATEVVQFTDASTIASGSITSWEWDFDDGSTSTDQSPTHIYAVGGTYNVSLTATSNLGCFTTLVQAVTVDTLPVADLRGGNVCLNDSVDFTNLSANAVTYLWNFGDNETSTDFEPSHLYSAPGSYTVTLTAISANGCEDQFQRSVIVRALPVADFSAISACPGDTIRFNDLSSVATGSLSHSWDFGDGSGSSILPSPSHVYTLEGTYSVRLAVASSFSCVDTIIKAVTVYPVPIAAFSADSVCDGEVVSFDNMSTIASGTVNYAWDFGDGTTSSNIEPTHTYAASGTYTVSLEATSANGCTDSTGQVVVVYPQPVASFTAPNTCDGDTVFFTNPSAGDTTVTFSWNFGDGITDTLASPTHLYVSPGMYTVTLALNSLGGCTDTATSTITIYPSPVAGFLAPDVCAGEVTTFTDLSTLTTGTLSYAWDLGDGTNSTASNPSHTYGAAGQYIVNLTVTSNWGCTDNFTDTVEVFAQPTSSFTGMNVCDGDSVRFTNNSTNDTTYTYSWNFGDGNFSTDFEPTHTYGSFGNYTVTLAVTTPNGCTDTSTAPVTVWAEPVAGFNGPDVCDGATINFTNTSTIGLGTLNYNWNFGDGNTSTSVNPTHMYDTTGIFTVVLTATSNNGCVDVDTNTVIVYPNPVANFSAGPVCYQRDVLFSNLTTIDFGTVTYDWDFDDGAIAKVDDPTHQYTGLGTFDVYLLATSDQGCVGDTTIEVTVQPNPRANFFALPVCAEDTMQFNDLSSIAAGDLSYQWDFGDTNTAIGAEPSHSYAEGGFYNVELIVTSDFGCADTISKSVEAYQLPFATFTSNDVCYGELVNFDNTSTVASGTIDETFWEYGNTETSSRDDHPYLYTVEGSYVVTLTVATDNGCIDETTGGVIVSELPDSIIRAFGPTEFCPGDSVELSAPSGTGYTYVWNTIDMTQNIVVTVTGNYNVTTTSAFGCTSISEIDVLVFDLPDVQAEVDTTISKGYSVQLTATGAEIYEWEPIDGLNFPNIADPLATPLETTTYVVTGTDTNECVNTDEVTVTVLEDFLIQPTNLLTPNGDGKNDNWFIINILTYPESTVQIFDRWGSLVFTKDAYSNEWRGTVGDNGSDLNEGTYYYIITFDQSDRIYKGPVSILR